MRANIKFTFGIISNTLNLSSVRADFSGYTIFTEEVNKMEKSKKSKEKKSIENRVEMNSEQRANFSPPLEIPATPFRSCPETCEEMINTYGTYEIQATANTENDFPAIAQGTPEYTKERPLEFFRGADDPNPAADTSDEHCL